MLHPCRSEENKLEEYIKSIADAGVKVSEVLNRRLIITYIDPNSVL
jgi:hypothetical protein